MHSSCHNPCLWECCSVTGSQLLSHSCLCNVAEVESHSMTWSIAETDAHIQWSVSVFLVFWEGNPMVTLSRYIHLWLLQWSARDNFLFEDSQEQRDGAAGLAVDWSPEWQ